MIRRWLNDEKIEKSTFTEYNIDILDFIFPKSVSINVRLMAHIFLPFHKELKSGKKQMDKSTIGNL